MKIPVMAVVALGMGVAGCASPVEPLSYSAPYPWTGLKLTMQGVWDVFRMPAGANVGVALSAIQARSSAAAKPSIQTLSDGYQYPDHGLLQIERVNRPLPNYLCRIVAHHTERRRDRCSSKRHGRQPGQISRRPGATALSVEARSVGERALTSASERLSRVES